jgi:hypothetical protein
VSAGALGRPPGLANFNSSLFAAWKGVEGDERIWWSLFDGQQWSQQQRINHPGSTNGPGTSVGPSLAAFYGALFAAWKGVEGDERIWVSTSSALGDWSAQQQSPGVGTSVGPSLAAFGRQLFAAWKGIEGDERTWLSTFGLDRPSWSPQQLGFGTTSIGPGLAAAPEVAGFPGEVLYAAWKDAEDQTLWSAFTRGHAAFR